MALSDYNPLNGNARKALAKTLRLFARAVAPRPARRVGTFEHPGSGKESDFGRGVEQTVSATARAAAPQPGEPRPPGPREMARRSAGPGNPPPSIGGAGYIDLAWKFLDPDPAQQKLWGSEEAKYGRASTAYGPTPQAYSSGASIGLTIERLATINAEASRDGYLTHKADLDFEIHQKWGHLKTAHRQRVAAVFRSPLQFRSRSKTDLGRFVCAFVRGVVEDCPGFLKSEEDLLGAGRSGYAGQEVVYQTPRPRRVTVGRKTYTVRDARALRALEWVHPRDFRWDPIRRRMLLDAGGTRYIDPFHNPDGSPTRKLILHGGDGEGDPHQRGYAYATDLLYMLSMASLSRWAVALEFFGVATPYMMYEGEGFADGTDVAEATAFIQAIGRGQPAVLHQKFGKVEITPTPQGIDARGQHAAILGYLNSECSKCVAGQTLTMEIGGSGSYAAANVQADSKEDVQIIDARLEADTQTHQLCRFIVEVNAVVLARAFGCSPAQVLAEIPIAYRVVDRRVDPVQRLAVFVGVKKELGLEPDPDQVAEELNLRLREREELVADGRPAPASPAAGAAEGEGGAPTLDLTSTDLGAIATVNQALASVGLPPKTLPDGSPDPDGLLTVAEFKAKHDGVIAAAAAAEEGGADPDEPARPARAQRSAAPQARREDPGVMVALYPPLELARELALPSGEAPEEVHVTLAYLGRRSEVGDLEPLAAALCTLAAAEPALAGSLGGIGVFPPSETSGGRAVAWVPVDVPGLAELRQAVVDVLAAEGAEASGAHGFAPHLTLAYLRPGAPTPAPVETRALQFNNLALVCGDERQVFALRG